MPVSWVRRIVSQAPAISAGIAMDDPPPTRIGLRNATRAFISEEVEAATEGARLGDLDRASREDVIERVAQVVGRDRGRKPRVVKSTLIAKAAVAVEDEDVERAGRPVGLRDPLSVIHQVREP